MRCKQTFSLFFSGVFFSGRVIVERKPPAMIVDGLRTSYAPQSPLLKINILSLHRIIEPHLTSSGTSRYVGSNANLKWAVAHRDLIHEYPDRAEIDLGCVAAP